MAFVFKRGRRRDLRPIVVGGVQTFAFTRIGFSDSHGILDGTNPTNTIWVGYIEPTGDIANGSGTISNISGGTPAAGDTVSGVFTLSMTGDLNGTTTISNVVLTDSRVPGLGDTLSGTNIAGGTTVVSYDPALHTILMSAAATGTSTGTALTYHGSISGTCTGYNAGTQQATTTGTASGTITGLKIRFTGQTHTYPAALNGNYQWGLNLYPSFSTPAFASFVIPPPPYSAGSTTATATVQMIDASSTVLTTATIVLTLSNAGGSGHVNGTWTVTSYTQGTETFATFNGVKFSLSGGPTDGWSMGYGGVSVLSPTIVLVDK